MINLSKIPKTTLSTERAQKNAAYALAMLSKGMIEYLDHFPNSTEMASDHLARNQATADALGFGEVYRSELHNLLVAHGITHLVKGEMSR